MCWANAVLQVLVYSPPFYRLFNALGKAGVHLRDKDREGQNRETPISLLEATVEFVKAFSARTMEDGASHVNGYGKMNRYAKGRGSGEGKERERERSDEWEEWSGESFLPSYVFDAMKENKRFDFMWVGLSSLTENSFDAYMCCRVVNRKTRKSLPRHPRGRVARTSSSPGPYTSTCRISGW